MINVVCVKYGNKYTEEHVNRLYEMVRRNLSLPFYFYCLTENTNGLHSDILSIPLDLNLELETYWYKLTIFNKDLYGNDNLTLYLDLDTIVQNPLDDLFKDPVSPMKIVFTDLFISLDKNHVEFCKHPNLVNSSIILFRPSRTNYITEHFLQNPDHYILEYKGVCRYLWYFFKDDFEFFEIIKDFYPVINNSQAWLNIPDHKKWISNNRVRNQYGSMSINFVPHSKIAMLNGASNYQVLERVYEVFSSYFK